jgi:hypothetical protein
MDKSRSVISAKNTPCLFFQLLPVGSVAARTSRASSAANCRAQAAPNPDDAPVMNTVLIMFPPSEKYCF